MRYLAKAFCLLFVICYLNFELGRYDCLLSQNLFNYLFVVIKDSACRYINYFFVTFSEFSYNARSMGRCRHLRSVKRHPRNVILVFIFFFFPLLYTYSRILVKFLQICLPASQTINLFSPVKINQNS